MGQCLSIIPGDTHCCVAKQGTRLSGPSYSFFIHSKKTENESDEKKKEKEKENRARPVLLLGKPAVPFNNYDAGAADARRSPAVLGGTGHPTSFPPLPSLPPVYRLGLIPFPSFSPSSGSSAAGCRLCSSSPLSAVKCVSGPHYRRFLLDKLPHLRTVFSDVNRFMHYSSPPTPLIFCSF
ncbi:hypothetical protein BO82DRAFT_46378 [Aspergillus uvarum CBS 121591]|uniref:Uncharacterized protein n=1 Tax=Aspergillus uvarum CBS 121591 TaxID=1448315 RepID=A0A319D5E9_9EURO|nr:hypothetical protein BO82DRAFT_46378 [Aspergillus uvarum CBS 121591]PYH83128.1 hypothetical protein BO82DRAFT_46378 [Aspergillus uvarum CBS 121591]